MKFIPETKGKISPAAARFFAVFPSGNVIFLMENAFRIPKFASPKNRILISLRIKNFDLLNS